MKQTLLDNMPPTRRTRKNAGKRYVAQNGSNKVQKGKNVLPLEISEIQPKEQCKEDGVMALQTA